MPHVTCLALVAWSMNTFRLLAIGEKILAILIHYSLMLLVTMWKVIMSQHLIMGSLVLRFPDASAYSPKPRQVPTPMNMHELWVLPDEHSVVDNDFLRYTPYIVNNEYMVLICTNHQHSIIHDRVSEHLHKHHPHCKVQTDFVSQLYTRFLEIESKMIHPLKVIDPIFSLVILLEQYIVCA